MPRIVRKQNPPAFRSYKKYKPYLRLDFERRCAYCHIPELRYGPPRNYTVDHFRPKSIPEFHDLICAYSNLFYVCQDCNSWKGFVWPKRAMQVLGFRFLDPCCDEFNDHMTVFEDGSIESNTAAGEYMVARLHLNRPYLCKWRREKVELLMQVREATLLASATSARMTEHTLASRALARLERRLTNEYGDYWQ